MNLLLDTFSDPIWQVLALAIVLAALVLLVAVRTRDMHLSAQQRARGTRAVLLVCLAALLVLSAGELFLRASKPSQTGKSALRSASTPTLPSSPSPIATLSGSPPPSLSPSPTPTPRLAHSIGEVLAGFCDAINRRDYGAAWQAFARALQARHPEPASASAWGRYTGCVVPEQSGDPSDWTVLVMTLAPGYRDQYGGQGQITYRFTMQVEDRAWKIGAVCQFLSEERLAVDWGA